jgi:hypothetical protein
MWHVSSSWVLWMAQKSFWAFVVINTVRVIAVILDYHIPPRQVAATDWRYTDPDLDIWCVNGFESDGNKPGPVIKRLYQIPPQVAQTDLELLTVHCFPSFSGDIHIFAWNIMFFLDIYGSFSFCCLADCECVMNVSVCGLVIQLPRLPSQTWRL